MALPAAPDPDRFRGAAVTVVGSGVIGLTSALRLAEVGARVAVVSSESVPTVSAMACAFWLPAWVPGPMADMLGGAVDRAVVEPSWSAYRAILEDHGYDAGIRPVTNSEYLEDGHPEPPAWLQELLPRSRFERVSLRCEGREYSQRWTFESVVIDMRDHLAWLRARAVAAGVRFDDEYLITLDDVLRDRRPDLVVNCSGLGSRQLVGDTAVSPVRGHLVLFEADAETLASLTAVAINEYYLIPRIRDVVVGGLMRKEDDPDTTDVRYDPADEELLLSKVDALSELAGAGRPTRLRRIADERSVGLRPHREGGYRLEVDRTWAVPVVHNYGHGGGGVTLAWGCADRVVELVSAELGGR